MISIYGFTDFRAFLRERIALMPNRGYGQARRLADFLRVHTTLVSQILVGKKNPTSEQAAQISEFFGLGDSEADYFLALVEVERAGNERLRAIHQRRLADIKRRSADLSQRMRPDAVLKDTEKAVFYSDWIYSAVRQLPSIEGKRGIDQIAAFLGVSRKRTKSVVEFLVAAGLLREKNGELRVGPQSTHLEANSPWIKAHHSNWRQKALESISDIGTRNLHYSGPLTVSAKDAARIQEQARKLIEETGKIVKHSPSEKFYCINVDFFEIKDRSVK
jgi:uncharacterized protein (TIGR02147 family)